MNKVQYVDAIYEVLVKLEKKVIKSDIKAVIDAQAFVLTTQLKETGRAVINDVVILQTKDTKERKGRNPRTGEDIIIKAGKRLTAKPSGKIKAAVTE